jgi:nitrile hydratase subunit alpha
MDISILFLVRSNHSCNPHPPAHCQRSAYRARAVRDPSGLLAEFGTVLPEGTAIRVHDSTADLRYLVVPERPPGTDDWSEERLAALVTRDSLIGVAQALTPAQLAARETAATAM